MKRIIFLITLIAPIVFTTLTGQSTTPETQQTCSITTEYAENWGKIDSKKRPHDLCYDGMSVSLRGISGIVALPKQSATLSAETNGGKAEGEWGAYTPLLIGYHKAKMDPLDPTNTGTNQSVNRRIFLDAPYGAGNRPDLYYYGGGDRQNGKKANVPKFLIHDGLDSKTSNEYIVNSITELSVATSHHAGVNLGYRGFEVGVTGGLNSNVNTSNNTMKRIFIETEVTNTYQLTEFARLSEDFLDALSDLEQSARKDEDFIKFMNDWGTHYSSAVSLGAAKYSIKELSADQVIKGEEKNWGVNVGFASGNQKHKVKMNDNFDIEETITGFSGGVSYDQSNKRLEKTGIKTDNEDLKSIGSNRKESPIKLELHPIYELCGAIKDNRFSVSLKEEFKKAFDRYFDALDKEEYYEPFIDAEELKTLREKRRLSQLTFKDGNFDAALFDGSHYYFFRGKTLYKRKQGSKEVITISEPSQEFPQIDQLLDKYGSIDGAIYFNHIGYEKYYFFKGDRYWRTAKDSKTVEGDSTGYLIKENWENLTEKDFDYVIAKNMSNKIDASWKVYFFKGDNYYRLEKVWTGKLKLSGPISISNNWSEGWRITSGDKTQSPSAGTFDFNGKDYYFFRNDKSLRKQEDKGIEKGIKLKGDWIN